MSLHGDLLRQARHLATDLIDRVEQATKDWHGVRRTAPADTFLVGSLAFGNMRN